MTSLENLKKIHKDLCNEALEIIEKKGHDYNREQQKGGDTLYNLKVCEELGIVDSACQGLLTRLSDKFMRLISLTKDPRVVNLVQEESVKDTIKDSINYLVYLFVEYQRAHEDAVRQMDPPGTIKISPTHCAPSFRFTPMVDMNEADKCNCGCEELED